MPPPLGHLLGSHCPQEACLAASLCLVLRVPLTSPAKNSLPCPLSTLHPFHDDRASLLCLSEAVSPLVKWGWQGSHLGGPILRGWR